MRLQWISVAKTTQDTTVESQLLRPPKILQWISVSKTAQEPTVESRLLTPP